jgi:hypothetical protein
MSRYNYDEYKRWWISNMNTHHVTLRQRIHTKRYIKWDHENRCRKTPKQTKNYHWRPTLWTQTTRWLTILIRGRRTWTSECRTPGCFVDYEEIKRYLNRILIYDCRCDHCDERLRSTTEGSTRLVYTELHVGLEKNKIISLKCLFASE